MPLAVAGIYLATDDFYATNEDTQLIVAVADGVLENDSGESDTCVFSTDVTGLDGNLPLDSVGAAGQFQFAPDPDFNGATTFTYVLGRTNGSACNSMGQTAAVTITVFEVNDPPTIVMDEVCSGDVTVDEDSGAFTDDGHCVEMKSFGPQDEATQELDGWVVSSNHPELFAATPTMTPIDGTYGRLRFTPAPDAHGTATVTVRGRDGAGTSDGGDDLSDPVQFDLRITSVNDAPTASADNFIVLKDRTLNVGVPGVLLNDDDIDGDSINATKVSNPAHGTVTLASDGAFSYTPASGYEGADAFSYRASDGSLSSPTRIVRLTVTPIPPVATPTPIPTVAIETAAPTEEPIPTESLPVESLEPVPTLEPGATPSPVPLTTPSPVPSTTSGPSATPAPGSGASSGAGVPLPLLLVLVLFVLLLAFGGAVYAPKWLAARRGGPPIE